MTTTATRPRKLPPAWFMHLFWHGDRVLYKLSGGRFLWTTSSKHGWGTLRLTTIGRKSSQQRSVIVGYIEDGPNLVVLAMNGWDEGHPSWWLNLEAHPDAIVRLARQPARPRVHAFAAAGDEPAIDYGSAGPRSTRGSMAMPVCGRSRRRSSSSTKPREAAA